MKMGAQSEVLTDFAHRRERLHHRAMEHMGIGGAFPAYVIHTQRLDMHAMHDIMVERNRVVPLLKRTSQICMRRDLLKPFSLSAGHWPKMHLRFLLPPFDLLAARKFSQQRCVGSLDPYEATPFERRVG